MINVASVSNIFWCVLFLVFTIIIVGSIPYAMISSAYEKQVDKLLYSDEIPNELRPEQYGIRMDVVGKCGISGYRMFYPDLPFRYSEGCLKCAKETSQHNSSDWYYERGIINYGCHYTENGVGK
jgi:hypothetical protein